MNLLRPRSIVRPILAEDDGRIAGKNRENWDDSVDAKAYPRLQVFAKAFYAPGVGLLERRDPRVIGRRRDGSRIAEIMGGAFGNSGMYLVTWIDVLDATQLAIDTSLTTHKIAMYTNTLSPNFSTDSAYSATNEVSGTGYTAGGQVIVSPTTTESPTGTIMYDLGDQIWASPTTVTARGAIEYADALAGNNLMFAWTFGGSDIVSTAGTFTIAWNALGAATWDITP